ncbi:MAG: spore germination protein GerW family protein [Candidatus Bathyarchaeia archaeon]|jgi:uncharacterized spore protein YtfJ
MSLQEFVQSIADRLHATGNVKTVFGEPIEAKGRMIIPVAKVVYGFGGGAGGKSDSEDGRSGQGVGGGIAVRPAGVLEIRDDTTEFIPFGENKKLIGVLFLGLLLGAWLAGRSRKS